ncbi:hypothetical protein GCM10029976_090590 [Kribbella albertanoniae]
MDHHATRHRCIGRLSMCEMCDWVDESPVWIGTQRYPAEDVPSRSDLAEEER